MKIKPRVPLYYRYTYLIIEIRIKTKDIWYITKALLDSEIEKNFIL
jgi:hypothetical protein